MAATQLCGCWLALQGHFEHRGLNLTHQQMQLDVLAATGLELIITEFSLFSLWDPPVLPGPVSYLDEDTQANATVEVGR